MQSDVINIYACINHFIVSKTSDWGTWLGPDCTERWMGIGCCGRRRLINLRAFPWVPPALGGGDLRWGGGGLSSPSLGDFKTPSGRRRESDKVRVYDACFYGRNIIQGFWRSSSMNTFPANYVGLMMCILLVLLKPKQNWSLESWMWWEIRN